MDGTTKMTAGTGGGQPLALRLLLKLLTRIRVGKLRVVAPDGTPYVFQGESGPEATIILRHVDTARRVLFGGDLGLAEAYMDGQWETPDLMAFLELGQRNMQALSVDRPGLLHRMLDSLVHALRRNTRQGARRNIHYHYDLGNAFYKLWLDETLTYSCALFDRPDQPLADGQRNKYRHLLNLLQLEPEHHLLEIGSGWGGFALHAARETGCRVTSITLSQEQLKEARARTQAAGLAERVKFELVDYRDVRGQFDRVVSIEMFEAVGERYWDAFFKAVHDRLKPAGRAALQIITINDTSFESYRRTVDFIQRYIFPGGILPSPSVWEERVRRAGLKTEVRNFYGRHYARTLQTWDQRVHSAEPEIGRLGFDRRFQRMWHYYLAYCHAGFATGHVDLMQTLLTRL
ncbi:MAG TPA: cyclopropane-fatty-acyl-phospholipid synthase family protein [Gammaproteobacteria bacterium]|nr:cyclopropane-fatty-acyl-phospholipid synthase family protein [Gammaproteobacteria bacterium]